MSRLVFSIIIVLLLIETWSVQALANPSSPSSDSNSQVSGTITSACASSDAWQVHFTGPKPENNDIVQVSRDGQPICQAIYVRLPNYGFVITRVDPGPENVPHTGDVVTWLKRGPSVSANRFAMLHAFQQAGVVANLQGQVYNAYYNGAAYGDATPDRGHESSGAYYGPLIHQGYVPVQLSGGGTELLNDYWHF